MSDAKTNEQPAAEAPESPAVVRKATGTTIKPKPAPKTAPAAKAYPETPPAKPAGKETPETPETDDSTPLSIFGWL